MTYTPPVAAGSPRYLQLLADTALRAEDRLDQDAALLWDQLHKSWNDLRHDKHSHATLANLATVGFALLSLRTGTSVPHLAAEAARIHIDKNAGYAGIGNDDPWANFRLSLMFGITPYEGVLVRLSDKYIRMCNLLANGANDRVGESLNDTLTDFVAYALIAICLSEEGTVV